MRALLCLGLLLGCGARTELPLPADGDPTPVTLELPPGPACAARPTTCPNWDLWPRKRLAELSEACFAAVGHTCGEFEVRFAPPGCATALADVTPTVSRAFLDCLGDALGRERWLCRQDGGSVRFVESCALPR